MININQATNVKLIETKKSVDWLINNTKVAIFDPISFKGYQRHIDERHCDKIVKFLENDFFLPTPIICSTDTEFSDDDSSLRVVDGQHRIHALKMIKRDNYKRYSEIEELEIPVIVMACVDEKLEIETFININKTAKKVDTSLALVLQNKINRSATGSNDLTIPRAEFLAVELARLLNDAHDNRNIWNDKILYEGQTKNTSQLITLRAFAKSARSMLNLLGRSHIISLDWDSQNEMQDCEDECYKFTMDIWSTIASRWPELFKNPDTIEERRIIQGPIGFSSVNIVIKRLIKERQIKDFTTLIEDFSKLIRSAKIDYQQWLPGNYFSKYSSESGYNIVADEFFASSSF